MPVGRTQIADLYGASASPQDVPLQRHEKRRSRWLVHYTTKRICNARTADWEVAFERENGSPQDNNVSSVRSFISIYREWLCTAIVKCQVIKCLSRISYEFHNRRLIHGITYIQSTSND